MNQYYLEIAQDFLKPVAFEPGLLESMRELTDTTGSYTGSGVQLEYWRFAEPRALRPLHSRNLFPKYLAPDRIRLARISDGPGLLPAHRDHGVQVVLNVYIQSDPRDSTIFYEAHPDAQAQSYSPDLPKNIYTQDQLVPRARIAPVTGDAYLLNVSEIHAVEHVSDQDRWFLSYMWCHHSWAEVCKIWQ